MYRSRKSFFIITSSLFSKSVAFLNIGWKQNLVGLQQFLLFRFLLLCILTFPIPPCFFNVSKTLPSTLNASQLGLSSMSCTNGEDRSEGSSNTRTKLLSWIIKKHWLTKIYEVWWSMTFWVLEESQRDGTLGTGPSTARIKRWRSSFKKAASDTLPLHFGVRMRQN